jgi:WhiB family redox-sensing transcriptional regulator
LDGIPPEDHFPVCDARREEPPDATGWFWTDPDARDTTRNETERRQAMPMPETPEWHHKAACRSGRRGVLDPELFFPSDSDKVREEEAKQVCRRCPVSRICRDEALDNGLWEGIWGGLNPTERRNLQWREARAAARAAS